MRFYEVQKALDEGKKVRRTGMPVGQFMRTGIVCYPGGITHIFLYKCRIVGNKEIADRIELNSELFDDDWEIVTESPEITAEEVISGYETWLMEAIHESYATTNFFNPYYVKCFLELNRLSASKLKNPENGDVKLIDGNHAVVKTESGKYTIVHLF